ncbi:hypothetical protein OG474_30425 [Kribbella sp. NBC_01505]|uniref:hypothetical protein n=1 Tax=Kribbella sp. NBC_01505 TaxID=2903580 RepID=UPI003869E277
MAEAKRLLADGKTYQEMVDFYLEKYGIETSISMWAGRRRVWGLEDRSAQRDVDIIPWDNIEQRWHWNNKLLMLKVAQRLAAGMEVAEISRSRYEAWLRERTAKNEVVSYEPDNPEDEGFYYRERRPGIDLGLVRVPDTA